MSKAAAAVFVKTPGLSPLKTRLAKTIGDEQALAFYQLSCAAIQQVLYSCEMHIQGYWAVAEPGSFWEGLPCIAQGEGGLGDRLHEVYSKLLEQYGEVILLGADTPQISADLLLEALNTPGDFVLGPAYDGGFYLFLGRKPIAADVWTAVTYSHSETLRDLVSRLKGKCEFLDRVLRDVDDEADLKALLNYGKSMPFQGLEAQNKLLDWCQQTLVDRSHSMS